MRLAVQFQSILDTFTPYDNVFAFAAAHELSESALSLSTILHSSTTPGSKSSSSSSLRQQRLNEIAEDTEEFTATVAPSSYVMDSPRAKDLLDAEVERNPFLYFDYHDGTYSFHPLLASYLHHVFSRKSRRWQQAQQLRAAHWYLQEGDYKQAIVLARRAGDYDTVLTEIEQGGRESLYGFSHEVAADTLQHASAAERAAHLEGCFYCVLYAFRCGKRLLAVLNRDQNRFRYDFFGQNRRCGR